MDETYPMKKYMVVFHTSLSYIKKIKNNECDYGRLYDCVGVIVDAIDNDTAINIARGYLTDNQDWELITFYEYKD